MDDLFLSTYDRNDSRFPTRAQAKGVRPWQVLRVFTLRVNEFRPNGVCNNDASYDYSIQGNCHRLSPVGRSIGILLTIGQVNHPCFGSILCLLCVSSKFLVNACHRPIARVCNSQDVRCGNVHLYLYRFRDLSVDHIFGSSVNIVYGGSLGVKRQLVKRCRVNVHYVHDLSTVASPRIGGVNERCALISVGVGVSP